MEDRLFKMLLFLTSSRVQKEDNMTYGIDFSLYISTSTSFFDVINECFQVFFHLVFVRCMLVEKEPNSHVPVVNGCNCHTVSTSILVIIRLYLSLLTIVKMLVNGVPFVLMMSIQIQRHWHVLTN